MPHADFSLVPSTVTSKSEFWSHIHDQLASLLEGQRNWVTNLSSAASLIYCSLLAFPRHFGDGEDAVNWCGFYLDASLIPSPRVPATKDASYRHHRPINHLFLGPFCGKPACQYIDTSPEKARGVCADAFLQQRTLVVPSVDLYPGHIACDGETKSEIVCPLVFEEESGTSKFIVGVLDLDCLAESGFGEEDRVGLEKIARLIVKACDW